MEPTLPNMVRPTISNHFNIQRQTRTSPCTNHPAFFRFIRLTKIRRKKRKKGWTIWTPSARRWGENAPRILLPFFFFVIIIICRFIYFLSFQPKQSPQILCGRGIHRRRRLFSPREGRERQGTGRRREVERRSGVLVQRFRRRLRGWWLQTDLLGDQGRIRTQTFLGEHRRVPADGGVGRAICTVLFRLCSRQRLPPPEDGHLPHG